VKLPGAVGNGGRGNGLGPNRRGRGRENQKRRGGPIIVSD
jgi:hypothetical protein